MTSSKVVKTIGMASYDATVGAAHTLDLATPTAVPRFSQEHHLQEYQPESSVLTDHHQQQPADFVTDPLKQLLVSDMSAFFQSEVAPRSAAINEDVASLQYEAAQLADKADAEKCTVLVELDRLHKLVASFQAQISEALGMMH